MRVVSHGDGEEKETETDAPNGLSLAAANAAAAAAAAAGVPCAPWETRPDVPVAAVAGDAGYGDRPQAYRDAAA